MEDYTVKIKEKYIENGCYKGVRTVKDFDSFEKAYQYAAWEANEFRIDYPKTTLYQTHKSFPDGRKKSEFLIKPNTADGDGLIEIQIRVFKKYDKTIRCVSM